MWYLCVCDSLSAQINGWESIVLAIWWLFFIRDIMSHCKSSSQERSQMSVLTHWPLFYPYWLHGSAVQGCNCHGLKLRYCTSSNVPQFRAGCWRCHSDRPWNKTGNIRLKEKTLQGVLPLKELRGDDLQVQAIQQSLRKALLDSVGQEP